MAEREDIRATADKVLRLAKRLERGLHAVSRREFEGKLAEYAPALARWILAWLDEPRGAGVEDSDD